MRCTTLPVLAPNWHNAQWGPSNPELRRRTLVLWIRAKQRGCGEYISFFARVGISDAKLDGKLPNGLFGVRFGEAGNLQESWVADEDLLSAQDSMVSD